MKPVLINSDVLIEVLRARDRNILERWDKLSQDDTPLFFSPVTIAEIWHGALPHEQSTLNALFSNLQSVPIDSVIGRRAGDYLRRFAKSHHLELGDALIAGTASLHGLALWTRNRKHYPMRDIEIF